MTNKNMKILRPPEMRFYEIYDPYLEEICIYGVNTN